MTGVTRSRRRGAFHRAAGAVLLLSAASCNYLAYDLFDPTGGVPGPGDGDEQPVCDASVDMQTDPDNCGVCGRKCGWGAECTAGECATGTAPVNGSLTDKNNNQRYFGSYMDSWAIPAEDAVYLVGVDSMQSGTGLLARADLKQSPPAVSLLYADVDGFHLPMGGNVRATFAVTANHIYLNISQSGEGMGLQRLRRDGTSTAVESLGIQSVLVAMSGDDVYWVDYSKNVWHAVESALGSPQQLTTLTDPPTSIAISKRGLVFGFGSKLGLLSFDGKSFTESTTMTVGMPATSLLPLEDPSGTITDYVAWLDGSRNLLLFPSTSFGTSTPATVDDGISPHGPSAIVGGIRSGALPSIEVFFIGTQSTSTGIVLRGAPGQTEVRPFEQGAEEKARTLALGNKHVWWISYGKPSETSPQVNLHWMAR